MFWFLAATAQFNLICTGSQTIFDSAGKEEKPYSITYRVDLDSNSYCEGDCLNLRPIKEVTQIAIIFRQEKDDDPSDYRAETDMVGRTDGKHVASVKSRSRFFKLSLYRSGQCEKAPFTGFPKIETKF